MDSAAASCPSESELLGLLSGDSAWHLALPRHLLAGCVPCWNRLERQASCLAAAALPVDEPLAMAVITAALAQGSTRKGRFQLMRPLHVADARNALRDPLAFCRLILHETLPSGFRPLTSSHAPVSPSELATTGGALIETTTAHLLRAAEPLITEAQRHDLEAIGLAYRATLEAWASRFDVVAALLETARNRLDRGSRAWEPRVIWHTAAAIRERLAGLHGGSSRIQHLENALRHLARAQKRLPRPGARLQPAELQRVELQRAELLHDTAQIHLALDAPPAAVEPLDTAWQLLSKNEATDGYLGSLIRLGQVQAALAMAEAQPVALKRHGWVKWAATCLKEVQEGRWLDPEEWLPEATRIARFLGNGSDGTDKAQQTSSSR